MLWSSIYTIIWVHTKTCPTIYTILEWNWPNSTLSLVNYLVKIPAVYNNTNDEIWWNDTQEWKSLTTDSIVRTLTIRRMRFLLKSIQLLLSPSKLKTTNPSPHKGHLPWGHKCLVCAIFYSLAQRDLVLHILPLASWPLSTKEEWNIKQLWPDLSRKQNSNYWRRVFSSWKGKVNSVLIISNCYSTHKSAATEQFKKFVLAINLVHIIIS